MKESDYIDLNGSVSERLSTIIKLLNKYKISSGTIDESKIRRLIEHGYKDCKTRVMQKPQYLSIGGLIPLFYSDIYAVLDRILCSDCNKYFENNILSISPLITIHCIFVYDGNNRWLEQSIIM